MQQDFDANFPDLGIQIIGINEHGQDFGNVNITEQMPWLQDVDTNGDGLGEVWQLWDVEWRDLTILDRNNVPVTTFNLTNFDLADPDNFAEVRAAFLEIAMEGDTSGEGESQKVLQSAAVDQLIAEPLDWLGS